MAGLVPFGRVECPERAKRVEGQPLIPLFNRDSGASRCRSWQANQLSPKPSHRRARRLTSSLVPPLWRATVGRPTGCRRRSSRQTGFSASRSEVNRRADFLLRPGSTSALSFVLRCSRLQASAMDIQVARVLVFRFVWTGSSLRQCPPVLSIAARSLRQASPSVARGGTIGLRHADRCCLPAIA